ncbi:adenine-specific DNA-methyltransferase [Agrobacterium pusense]|uniref:DNA adenine methylase n=1 Tax=Agrobacterium pusense TaxID=648995 RepID=UPI002856DA8D|nr:DNA adenine methylase [Agrobacterium pusense]MDR6189192.1 adenine-specific DNA-methyltransferase [Agrobacterium pusense]
MGINISYMGTKREIAPAVVDVINSASPGIALDVFAGMCSVGEALAPHRTVWTNDVQTFAYEVACALFTDGEYPLDRVQASDLCFDSYRAQKENLAAYFSRSLNIEHDLLRCVEFDDFDKVYSTFKSVFATERARPINSPFSLFTQLYPDTYFGLMQAIEVDAIVAAIEGLNDRQGVGDGHRRWLRVCLGRAMLRTANSTGHFAQFLKPKASSFRTFLRQRRRGIWEEWLNSIDDVTPVGTAEWRKGNKSFNRDCLDLIPSFKNKLPRPSVIYADPPYTDDQYSRFYHVLETLILYDYPEVSGSGIYRSSRFRTPFSLKSQTVSALHELVSAVSSAGADLVLSYPTNGLVYKAGHDPIEIMKKHFRSVERCYAISHDHSTFGASKGLAKSPVTEQIFLGRV